MQGITDNIPEELTGADEGATSTIVIGNTEPSVDQGFVDNHDWTKGKVLDFDQGYLNYGQDGKPEFPPNSSIQFEQEEDGQTYITIVVPDDKGIDHSAAAFLDETEEAKSTTVDYPIMDLSGRPRFVLNRKYRYARNENGSMIMRAPHVHIDHFNYAEHMHLGNELRLNFGYAKVRAADKELKLRNGLMLTYGQINGLGGDFFGGFKPICQGKDFEEQREIFIQAYNCLGEDPNAVEETHKIVETRKKEVEAIGAAKDSNGTISAAAAYREMATDAAKNDSRIFFGHKEDLDLQWITKFRAEWGQYQAPSYMRLAQLNLDHFGEDAHTAYNAGHYCAMAKAAEGGEPGNLEIAYAMNAFADHYLGDCFAAGHMRTPRRFLHAEGGLKLSFAWKTMNLAVLALLMAPDLCSKARL